VTDTRHAENAGIERLNYIYHQIKYQGERLNVPVLVGEWGAFYGVKNESNLIIPVAKSLEKQEWRVDLKAVIANE
jgi:endoglycosylceramidase